MRHLNGKSTHVSRQMGSNEFEQLSAWFLFSKEKRLKFVCHVYNLRYSSFFSEPSLPYHLQKLTYFLFSSMLSCAVDMAPLWTMFVGTVCLVVQFQSMFWTVSCRLKTPRTLLSARLNTLDCLKSCNSCTYSGCTFWFLRRRMSRSHDPIGTYSGFFNRHIRFIFKMHLNCVHISVNYSRSKYP